MAAEHKQAADAGRQKLPPHPLLFATAARFDSHKSQKDSVSLQFIEMLRSDAEKILTSAPIAYPSEGLLLSAMREV
jgi:hypothetical protein